MARGHVRLRTLVRLPQAPWVLAQPTRLLQAERSALHAGPVFPAAPARRPLRLDRSGPERLPRARRQDHPLPRLGRPGPLTVGDDELLLGSRQADGRLPGDPVVLAALHDPGPLPLPEPV